MDNTPEYIEICRKAVEIQEWWYNNTHTISEFARSYFISSEDNSLIHYYDFGDYPQHSKDYTWLPCQDQLQGIMLKSGNVIFDIICRFTDWFRHESDDSINDSLSGEQIWLTFVMHEKYGKKWDGKDWIKI